MKDKTQWEFIWLLACLRVLLLSPLTRRVSAPKTWPKEQFIRNGFQCGSVRAPTTAFSLEWPWPWQQEESEGPDQPRGPRSLRNAPGHILSCGPAQKATGQAGVRSVEASRLLPGHLLSGSSPGLRS